MEGVSTTESVTKDETNVKTDMQSESQDKEGEPQRTMSDKRSRGRP